MATIEYDPSTGKKLTTGQIVLDPSTGKYIQQGTEFGTYVQPTVQYDPDTGKKLKSGQQITYNGTTYKVGDKYTGANAYGGNSNIVNYSSNTGAMLNPGETTTYGGQTVKQGQILPAAQAPANAGEVNNQNSFQFPGTNVGVGNTYDAQGAISGLDSYVQNQLQTYQKQMSQAQQNQTNILSKLMNTSNFDVGEVRSQMEEQYGIQSKIAEINSLQQNLQSIISARDAQIAKTNDTLGSMNFINNQIQQIKNNSDPEINALTSNINLKAGILTQNQQLVQQAVSDAVSTYQMKYSQLMDFYQINQDIISNLDSNYKWALEQKIEQERYNYQQQQYEYEQKAGLIQDAAKYGIDLSSMWNSSLSSLQQIYGQRVSGAVKTEEIKKGSIESSGTYTIKSGDTGRNIADKLGLNWEALELLNPGVNWNNLQPGQKLNTDTSKIKINPSNTSGVPSYDEF